LKLTGWSIKLAALAICLIRPQLTLGVGRTLKSSIMSSKKVTSSIRAALVLALVVGCAHPKPWSDEPPGHWANVGRTCNATVPKTALPAALRDTLVNPFDGRGQTGPWTQRAAIARGIPGGWGGVTRREKGLGFAIYLTDTTQRIAALDALVKAKVPYVSSETEARPGRWTYGELYDWFRYVHTHLRKVPVTMWSLDEQRNRIVYGVETEEGGVELDRQLTALNVPCFLVFREVTGQFHLLSSPAPNTR
jgi:hypothetical protein